MKFYNTLLQTKSSTIKAEIDFNYDRKNLSKFNELVYINANFKNSFLSTLDLNKLYKEIKGNDILRFDTSLSGSLNNFSLENLKLTSDQGIKIIGDLNLINAVKQEDFYLASNFEELSLLYFEKFTPQSFGE